MPTVLFDTYVYVDKKEGRKAENSKIMMDRRGQKENNEMISWRTQENSKEHFTLVKY